MSLRSSPTTTATHPAGSDGAPAGDRTGGGTPTGSDRARQRDWGSSVLWTLVGLSLLNWTLTLQSWDTRFGWAAVVTIVAGIWGLLTVIASWLPQRPAWLPERGADVLSWVTALLLLATFSAWTLTQNHNGPAYGTDELSFDQYSALLVTHGLNPYTHSLAASFPMFSNSPGGFSYTLTGARVLNISYPALSFLIYVPFLWLGWSTDLAVWIDVLGWSLAVLIAFRLLPRNLRAAALVIGAIPMFVDLAQAGLTDTAFMPLMVLVAYRWDRFDRHSWRTYLGPLALGLACSAKQTAWPVVPFLLIALLLDEQARSGLTVALKRAGSYLAVIAAVFLVVNIGYIVASPRAWWHGTMTPLLTHLVPSGQGAIGLSLFLHLGGGSLGAWGALSLLILVLALVSYVAFYGSMRPLLFMLPTVAYFFAERSYMIYLCALALPGLVAAVSAGPGPEGTWRLNGADALGRLRIVRFVWRPRLWAAGAAVVAVLCVADFAYAITRHSPLAMKIVKVGTITTSDNVRRIELDVSNRSGDALHPLFALQTGQGLTSFWHVLKGPAVLAPHASDTYILTSPDILSELRVDGGIHVVALTSSPATVSVSSHYVPSMLHTGFDPIAFDSDVPAGHTITLKVLLLGELDQPVRKPGVEITMTQSVVAHSGGAEINGGAAGAPGYAVTNADGVAVFRITGTDGDQLPVVFTASAPDDLVGYKAEPGTSIEIRFKR